MWDLAKWFKFFSGKIWDFSVCFDLRFAHHCCLSSFVLSVRRSFCANNTRGHTVFWHFPGPGEMDNFFKEVFQGKRVAQKSDCLCIDYWFEVLLPPPEKKLCPRCCLLIRSPPNCDYTIGCWFEAPPPKKKNCGHFVGCWYEVFRIVGWLFAWAACS